MPKRGNTILQFILLWHVVFLSALSLNVHAGSEEAVSLFIPVASGYLPSDEDAAMMMPLLPEYLAIHLEIV